MVHYVYDGSYTGFLTAVFDRFSFKDQEVRLVSSSQLIAGFFDENTEILSDSTKAKRVTNGLLKKLQKSQVNDFYCVFLSEDALAIQYAFDLIFDLFKKGPEVLENYGDERIIYFAKTLKSVRREKHRMKAFIRFKKTTNGMYVALIDPDFNVLPLIPVFFRKRYTDQSWLIYDIKRNYGLLYDLKSIVEVKLLPVEKEAITTTAIIELDDEELFYQELWKQYFKSTTIEARKNMKLHLQHVPKRYWKYLIEK